MENLLFSGVPILKHIRVYCHRDVIFPYFAKYMLLYKRPSQEAMTVQVNVK